MDAEKLSAIRSQPGHLDLRRQDDRRRDHQQAQRAEGVQHA
jgi:hypothetical protein